MQCHYGFIPARLYPLLLMFTQVHSRMQGGPAGIIPHCLAPALLLSASGPFIQRGKGKRWSFNPLKIFHVVMGADLNHHGTLFAGQGAKCSSKRVLSPPPI
jgi:hypothetical protein